MGLGVLVCRACGSEFGTAPPEARFWGQTILDICLTCQAREIKISEIMIWKRTPVPQPWEVYQVVVSQLEKQVNDLPSLEKAQTPTQAEEVTSPPPLTTRLEEHFPSTLLVPLMQPGEVNEYSKWMFPDKK
jgi:hypothetical protein